MKKRKMVLFIAATLDGYIATLDHRLDWLFNVEGEGDNGISAFYETIDAIIMGRMTYDWIQDHSETFPYQDRSVYVFSKKQREKEGLCNLFMTMWRCLRRGFCRKKGRTSG